MIGSAYGFGLTNALPYQATSRGAVDHHFFARHAKGTASDRQDIPGPLEA